MCNSVCNIEHKSPPRIHTLQVAVTRIALDVAGFSLSAMVDKGEDRQKQELLEIRMKPLGFLFNAIADSYQENCTFAFCMW
jgi:hypothetical protein